MESKLFFLLLTSIFYVSLYGQIVTHIIPEDTMLTQEIKNYSEKELIIKFKSDVGIDSKNWITFW